MSNIPPSAPLDIPRKDWQGQGEDSEMANYLAIERALANVAVPVGSVLPFAGATAPRFYLLCNGLSVGVKSFAALFSVIGYTYGGAGQSFTLPNLQSRIPMGVGTGVGLSARTLAQTGGEEVHTLTQAEMPSHSHQILDPQHSHGPPPGSFSFVDIAGGGNWLASTGITQTKVTDTTTASAFTGISANLTGGSGSHNNVQPFLALNFIIRAL